MCPVPLKVRTDEQRNTLASSHNRKPTKLEEIHSKVLSKLSCSCVRSCAPSSTAQVAHSRNTRQKRIISPQQQFPHTNWDTLKPFLAPLLEVRSDIFAANSSLMLRCSRQGGTRLLCLREVSSSAKQVKESSFQKRPGRRQMS